MTNNSTKPVAPTTPANGYEQTKQMLEQTAQTGLLSPLMSMLSKLLEDPILKKTMEGMPVQDEASFKKTEAK